MNPLLWLVRGRWDQRQRRHRCPDCASEGVADARFARSAEASTDSRRPIAGASDADVPAIVQLIAKSAMCVERLVKKTGLPTAEAETALRGSSLFVVITVEGARCDGCLQTQTVYRLGDHAVAPVAPGTITKNEAIWRFLNEHRGESFCSSCLGRAIGTSRRLDRALLEAEGRGAHRQQGRGVPRRRDWWKSKAHVKDSRLTEALQRALQARSPASASGLRRRRPER